MTQPKRDYSKKILTIPNVLTMFRLLLVPVVVELYIVLGNRDAAIIALAVSAITDIADGQIARRFHMVSDIGKVLDPVADKLTQAAVLLCLATRFPNMMVIFFLMFIKETILGVEGFLVVRHTGQVYGAEWHGKLTTVLMFTMYILHLLWLDISPVMSDNLILAVACVMALSFVLYSIRNYRLIKAAKLNKLNSQSKGQD